MVTVPSSVVVLLAGILGFAFALPGEGEASEASSSLIFLGEVQVAFATVVVDTTVVAGEPVPRFLFLERKLGAVTPSSISTLNVDSTLESSSELSSCS